MATDPEGQTRPGRPALVDAAADLLAEVDMDDLARFLGARAVARRADVSVGTVSYHFPVSGPNLVQVAVERAYVRAAEKQLEVLAGNMDSAGVGVGRSEETAIDDFLAALARNLETNSPSHGTVDPVIESREAAFYLAASVAPRDSRATAAIERSLESERLIREAIAEQMLVNRQRRWSEGVTKESAALAQEALIYGFLLIRRFNKTRATPDEYAAMVMRLFDACTESEFIPETLDYRDSLLVPPKVPHLDKDKRAAVAHSAASVYEDTGWRGLTTVAVAERAGVSRPTVVANFKDRNGLAAAVWARCVPELRSAAERDSGLPVHSAVHAYLERLAMAARRDRALSAAYLEGVLAYAIEHGPRMPEDPADPRNFVPLPQLLEPTIERHASHFRPGNADTKRQISDTAELLAVQALNLTLTQPSVSPTEIAKRICVTTFAGMLKRRPAP